jgi:hypothetical protein
MVFDGIWWIDKDKDAKGAAFKQRAPLPLLRKFEILAAPVQVVLWS